MQKLIDQNNLGLNVYPVYFIPCDPIFGISPFISVSRNTTKRSDFRTRYPFMYNRQKADKQKIKH